ncbi:DUF294 nucleotidyltransferase-like domain-containing protein [Halobacillus shinanisalinarum]|uniref:DUF294 nucleotidyltransferase-like domain-containing protein n=1 Tax=Halobacillus shinanisalinarum TaxID=2932258 RepID=A0ABY4H0Q2_9BACI|nr:DUF294 nucleotidyltransferase-like domain-containing protein [Halobacillus shinanisalinarum]UOQ93909.1 DUF294 nucleotidyltransferase-like domain-containing protein [Halobacillus shinanisalinarum]
MLKSYVELRQWRVRNLNAVSTDHRRLNLFHDELIKATVQVAMEKVRGECGDPPAPFAFFLMGSAGRFEQSVWSDQDHGIIYDSSDNCQTYFLTLGAEISHGLTLVGYERCEGMVMASNPLWCQSIHAWKVQILDWLTEASWQSLRHFLTLFDSRVLIGEADYLNKLKNKAFTILQHQPELYLRLVENVDFIKKGVGVFGQLLPEQHGEKAGNIQLKQTAFFPYVNAIRLLALKERIGCSSTLSRFKELQPIYPFVKGFEGDFIQLLEFRLYFRKDAKSYKEVQLIPIDTLSRVNKQELKQVIKRGHKLFSETKTIVEKECSP